jgi:hypothetical protein
VPFTLENLRRLHQPYAPLDETLRGLRPRPELALLLVRPIGDGEDIRFGRIVARAVAPMPPEERPMLIASSREMAATLATFSGAPVARAYTRGIRVDHFVRDVADHRIPWISFLASDTAPGLILAAHQLGVRVITTGPENVAARVDARIVPTAR